MTILQKGLDHVHQYDHPHCGAFPDLRWWLGLVAPRALISSSEPAAEPGAKTWDLAAKPHGQARCHGGAAAAMEGFSSPLRTERTARHPFRSRQAARADAVDYIGAFAIRHVGTRPSASISPNSRKSTVFQAWWACATISAGHR